MLGKIDRLMEPYPRMDTTSAIRTVAEAATAGIPNVGGPLALVLNKFIPSRLDRRREEWFVRLGALVEDLDSRGVDLDAPKFVDAVIRASIVAVSAGTEERIELLVAALEGVAGPVDDQGRALVERAFNCIERLTEAHVHALRQLLHRPIGSVPKLQAVTVARHLHEDGWEPGLQLDTIAATLVELGLVDHSGVSGRLAYGKTDPPAWYDPQCVVSLYGQWFLRFVQSMPGEAAKGGG